FAEYVGVAFASLGKGNDLVGDGLLDVVGAIARPQSDASHLEGHAHDARNLRVEVLAVNEWPDRHGALSREKPRPRGHSPRGCAPHPVLKSMIRAWKTCHRRE